MFSSAFGPWLRICAAGVLSIVVSEAVFAQGARDVHLREAWDLASAIGNDAKDRARSQDAVARAWIDAGEPDRAIELAGQIGGWRKLALIADAASWWAERGETNRAARALMEAEYLAPGIRDWPYDRVRMHLARAMALLGRRTDLRTLAQVYPKESEYYPQVLGAVAIERALCGETEEAASLLSELAPETVLDVAGAPASGVVSLLSSGRLPGPVVVQALEWIWPRTAPLAGWAQVDRRLDMVDVALATGDPARARAWMQELTSDLRGAGYLPHIAAHRLAEAALRWGRLGDADRVAALTGETREIADRDLELIERPAVYACLAEAFHALGDAAARDAQFAEALEVTVGLLNARPRALAGVEVSLALARCGAGADAFEGPRRALRESLGIRGD